MEKTRCPGCIKMLKKKDKDLHLQIAGKLPYSQEVKWHKSCWEKFNPRVKV